MAGAALQGLVDASEIMEHGVEADHLVVRLDLLAEPVGEAREPAHPHAEVQVLAFNVGRALCRGGLRSGSS